MKRRRLAESVDGGRFRSGFNMVGQFGETAVVLRRKCGFCLDLLSRRIPGKRSPADIVDLFI